MFTRQVLGLQLISGAMNRSLGSKVSLFLLIVANAWGSQFIEPAASKPTKVAFIFSKTGGNSIVEKEMERGFRVFKSLYPDEFKKINIETFDDRGSVEGALDALKKIKEKDIRFVIGIRDNEVAVAASQVAEEAEFLFMTPLATYSRTTLGKKNTFQISPNEVLRGAALARFATHDLSREKILILVNSRSVFSQAFADSFDLAIKKSPNVQVVRHVSNGEDLKLEALKDSVIKFKPDLVFVSDEVTNSAILAKYIYKIDPYLPFLTGESFGNENAIKVMLKEVPKMRLYFASLWSPKSKNPESENFKKGYREIYSGAQPSQEAALTFDAFLVFFKAIRLAAPEISIDRVRYFLEHDVFQTSQGGIDFKTGPTHSPVGSVHIKVTNITKSKFVKTLRAKWKLEP